MALLNPLRPEEKCYLVSNAIFESLVSICEEKKTRLFKTSIKQLLEKLNNAENVLRSTQNKKISRASLFVHLKLFETQGRIKRYPNRDEETGARLASTFEIFKH